jgi:hypothetical protein
VRRVLTASLNGIMASLSLYLSLSLLLLLFNTHYICGFNLVSSYNKG